MPAAIDARAPTAEPGEARHTSRRLGAAIVVALLLASSAVPATAHAEGPSATRPIGVLRRTQPPAANATPTPVAPPAGGRSGALLAGSAAEPVAPLAQVAVPTGPPAALATPSPVATPTMPPEPALSALPAASGAVAAVAAGARLVLDVPGRSQFDGSVYQASNCGPTALGMVLAAYGVEASSLSLRQRANALQGTSDPRDGIALDHLAEIARQAGLRTVGLYAGGRPARWTVDDVRAQVRKGYPVVTLVKYRSLPYVRPSATQSDHYVVVAGLEGRDLLVNDPAMAAPERLIPLSADDLQRAWAASSIPGQAVAIAPGSSGTRPHLPAQAPAAEVGPIESEASGARDEPPPLDEPAATELADSPAMYAEGFTATIPSGRSAHVSVELPQTVEAAPPPLRTDEAGTPADVPSPAEAPPDASLALPMDEPAAEPERPSAEAGPAPEGRANAHRWVRAAALGAELHRVAGWIGSARVSMGRLALRGLGAVLGPPLLGQPSV
jgi:hypothetical protein